MINVKVYCSSANAIFRVKVQFVMKIISRFVLFLVILVGLAPSSLCAKLIIHYKPAVSETDRRQDFVFDIIQAIMDSTVLTDGPYVMEALPEIPWDRLRLSKIQKKYPNFVIRISGVIDSVKGLEYIPIPINRGIVGYRISLILESQQDKFDTISNLNDLISSGLTAGQGPWPDADILRENKLKVIVGPCYEGLFRMLVAKRFDYFPRGVSEVFQELKTWQGKYPQIRLEHNQAFYYPLPRILATSKGNYTLAKRIEKGLKVIFSNGIHRKIWLKYNRKWVKKAQLDHRKIIVLRNDKVLPDLPFDQPKYWYHIEETL